MRGVWPVLVVSLPDNRNELTDASENSSFVRVASYYIVIVLFPFCISFSI